MNFVTALFTGMLFLSCLSCTSLMSAEKPEAQVTSKKMENKFLSIQSQSRKKKIENTLQSLNEFISKNQNRELTLSAYLLKAKLLKKQNKKTQACSIYHKATRLPFFYKNQQKAFFASANCLNKENKIEEALSTLQSLISSPKESLKTKQRAALKQWDFIKKNKEKDLWKIKSLSNLLRFYSKHPNKKTWQSLSLKLISHLKKEDLFRLSKKSQEHPVLEGFILYKTGVHFWRKKNNRKAQHFFSQALSSHLFPSTKKKVEKYLSILSSIKKTNPYLIGVVLPLSGKQKILGKKILRGLNMGFDLEKDSPWQLVVADSKSHPDVTKEEVEKLIYKHNVIGLIGGVTSRTANVIADLSSQYGVPSILFSQKSELTKNKDFAFQNALTSGTLMEHLTQSIFKKPLSITKVAILASDDPYGKEYTTKFSEAFEKQGGVITNVQTYKPGEVDFKKPLQKLTHLYDLKDREEEYEQLKTEYLKKHPGLSKRSKKLNPENLLKPQFEFEAIFIPDSFKTLKKIEDHLKYFDIKDVFLLGTNLWKKKQIRSWSKDRPLVFINTPVITNQILANSKFFKDYKKIFLSSPSFFERQAYNTSIAFKSVLQKKVRNRLDLQKELESMGILQGSLHPFKISETRTFIYPLSIFTTEEGRVITLDSIPVK